MSAMAKKFDFRMSSEAEDAPIVVSLTCEVDPLVVAETLQLVSRQLLPFIEMYISKIGQEEEPPQN